MAAGDRPRMITYAELERRLLRVARGLPLEPDELAYVAGELMPDAFAERPAGEATDAVPGSAEKLRALERRAARGESLFGPADDNHHPDRALLVGRHDGNGATARLDVVAERVTAPGYAPRGRPDYRHARASTRNAPPAAAPRDGTLTAGQLAARLGVSRRTVLRWTRKGRLPCAGGAGGRRYDLRAVTAALAGEPPGTGPGTR